VPRHARCDEQCTSQVSDSGDPTDGGETDGGETEGQSD
jgi:hypothetical protein